MGELFNILKEILGLLMITMKLLEQIQKNRQGLKSGKRPRTGRSHSQTSKKKKK